VPPNLASFFDSGFLLFLHSEIFDLEPGSEAEKNVGFCAVLGNFCPFQITQLSIWTVEHDASLLQSLEEFG